MWSLSFFFFRDGSEVFRDPRTGDVSAEILVKGASGGDYMPVLASFSAPWPLGKRKSAYLSIAIVPKFFF